MGYKNFQVPKTIYLPISRADEDLTLAQYKEKYGIDLKPFIILNGDSLGGSVDFKFPMNTEIKMVLIDDSYSTTIPAVGNITNVDMVDYYVEGSTDGVTAVLYSTINESFGWGMNFAIKKETAFNIDNILVSEFEL